MNRRGPGPPPVPATCAHLVIEAVTPTVDDGRFSVKSVVGEPVEVAADVFAHGHEVVRARLRHRRAGARGWSETPMAAVGNDRFVASFTPAHPGPFEFEIAGEVDPLATWLRDTRRRVDAGRFDPDDPVLGAEALDACAERCGRHDDPAVFALGAFARALRDADDLVSLVRVVEAIEEAAEVFGHVPLGEDARHSARYGVLAQRELAVCSAWYECFPRSLGPRPGAHGTLTDLIGHLDYLTRLGFDICYLPPIHPIGTTNRKGRDNAPVARPDDVGSPWAIGAGAGGHTAIHPALGTLADFDALVAAAAERGLEIALDLAFQCSPDHPWVREHPDWFHHRPDGSIACAENPPKRYEDVYPLDFDTPDRAALFQACFGVVEFWIGHGVRVFRVDNPHTKPFAFWEWLIAEARALDPGVVFLAEAFTRPKVMHRLAKAGFDQSYTYFTWRDTKAELTEYLDELAHGPGRAYFRPNLWPNTPDILAKSLQRGGRPSFVTRLLLAGCASASYGIYGPLFELCIDEPHAPGSEEYAHSEKYEIRQYDRTDPRSIAEVITRVNGARRDHPALRRDDSLAFHPVDNDEVLCWSKRDPNSGDAVLCVVSLDPDWSQSGHVELDLGALGLPDGAPFVLRDLLDDSTYTWHGARNYVLLDPARGNAHLFVLEPGPGPVSR